MAEKLQDKASEFAKKILTAGVGTVFLTEDALKKVLAEIKLPKEILASILETANKSKNEFMQSFSQEIMSKVLDHIEPQELIEEILRKNELHFEVKLNVKPKSDSEQA